MNDKLCRLISDTLGVPSDGINGDTAMDSMAAWDSVMHLNLCLSIEKEFGIRLTPDEIMGMTSLAAIEAVLARHTAA